MSDDPYKAPENSSAPKMVTNQKQRSAVIFLANVGGLAAARWLVDEKHLVLAMSAMLLFVVLSDTIWSFVWPVIEQVDEYKAPKTETAPSVHVPDALRWCVTIILVLCFLLLTVLAIVALAM